MEVKKLGRENYAKLQRLWVDSNMESLCDFLMYYNNQDTYPFVKVLLQCRGLLRLIR